MVRPIKYLLVKEYQDTPNSELNELPLNAISGITEDDIPNFEEIEIETIPKLADTEFSKPEGKGPSDYKLNRGISYAIDIMIHVNEPGVHDEIMPIDELLDKDYEKTPDTELAGLDTVAIEGIAPGNAKKIKNVGIKNIKELAEANLDKIKSAEIRDWQAEKFSQYAKWVMAYAEENIKKPTMENIEWEIKNNMLIIKFDKTKEFGKSKSGKTIIVANSHGGRRLTGTELTLGMFTYKYPEEKETKKKKVREMQNIDMKIDGNIVTLTVDTTKNYGSSASGKSTIIASSRGNKKVEETEVYLGLNVYKLKKK